MVTAAAVIGAVIGGRLTALVRPAALRQAFGWFVLVMASVILAGQTNPGIGAAAAALTLAGAAMYVTCSRTTYCPLRRLIRTQVNAGAT